ncbi:MAG: sigma 54-interacting transcriptional regulator [Acidobacteriota bacterium]
MPCDANLIAARSPSELAGRRIDEPFDVLVLDIRDLSGASAIEALDLIGDTSHRPVFVVRAGQSLDGALAASCNALRVIRDAELVSTPMTPSAPAEANAAIEVLAETGRAPAMQQLLKESERVAATDAAVLIGGETGTGKGLLAAFLHAKSRRAHKAWLRINCSALPRDLLESELFGYERGAFTGAAEAKPGLFEVGDGGTIFLDEIGEMPAVMQAKLLQVLDSGEIRRIGAVQGRRVDVRIIAATNIDLQSAMSAGRFRSDLYYRLSVVELTVPPLRERMEDLENLVTYFLRRFSPSGRIEFKVSTEAWQQLNAAAWPGNVRQLENALRRATVLTSSHLIQSVHLPPTMESSELGMSRSMERSTPDTRVDPDNGFAPKSLDQVTREHVATVLGYTGWNRARAARILGIDAKTLSRKIKRFALDSTDL